MFRKRGLGLNNLLGVVFPLSIFHGSCALDTSFQFSSYIYCYCLVLGIFSSVINSMWAWSWMFAGVLNAGFIVDVSCYFLFCFMWVILAVELIRQEKQLRLVIQELEEVDSILKFPKYKASFYLIPISCAIVANIGEKVLTVLDWKDYVLSLAYYFHMSPIVTFSSQYVFLMAVASDQLSFITLQLQSSRKSSKINTLVTIHKGLCDTARRINDIFNVHLLITTSIPFMIISLKVYSTIMCIKIPDDYNDVWLFSENICYITMNTIILWCIVHCSSSIKDKAKQFNIELLYILLNNNDIDSSSELQEYLHMKWSVKPTACGFYNIDYPLLTHMATGLLTFVTYLLQITEATQKRLGEVLVEHILTGLLANDTDSGSNNVTAHDWDNETIHLEENTERNFSNKL